MLLYVVCLLAAVIPASAGGSSREPSRVIERAVLESQVEGWLRTWQHRLGLQEWNVDIRIVRTSELNPDTLGHLKWNSDKKIATIKVLDPVDYDLPPSEIPRDIELTIVHELVHLQLSVLPRDRASKAVEEKVVQRLARALIALDRKQ